ncbi:MAG TPA: sigma-54 dependent transcriptional regulator [Terriglobales bacterium]|nr:sigma-54 dependent transcriptional regulator [Terriglobales bacterium]
MAPDRILVVDDEPSIREVICRFLKERGFEVLTAPDMVTAERVCRSSRPELVVLDYSLPDGNALDLIHRLKAVDRSIGILILTGYGTIELAVQAVKLGADQFLTKPIELSVLLLLIQRTLEGNREKRRHTAEKFRVKREINDPFQGKGALVSGLSKMAHKVAGSDSSVLISGETGTGKGVLARWLHQNSPRALEPFVDLNCSGLSRELLDTELFGHERGAFTGAVQNKLGLLEAAHKGTVFLDEIGDLDLQIQPRLLKVLEEKRFRRLGDVRDRSIDIRLIAASHRSLPTLVGEQKFRSDLYFRISTIPLHVPPLRQRREDIPILAESILVVLAADMGAGKSELSVEAMHALQLYSWPGNIRELRNVLERAILLKGNAVLDEADLHFDVRHDAVLTSEARPTLGEAEKQLILQALAEENGHVALAAKSLGIPRSSLYSKLKQYRVSHPHQV